MLADLDLLLTSVFCTADDLLPTRPGNARRSLTDAEVVTLCVAQSIMGISSDARFVRIARKRLGHLFPTLTKRSGFHKRRNRLTETIEAMIAVFAAQSPGFHDDLLLADSTPVECARSRETVKRAGSSSLGDAIARRRRLWLLRQPQPLLLGTAAAHADGARRNPAGDGADLPQGRRARGLPAAAGAGQPQRSRNGPRRQGLCRRRLRSRRRRLGRHGRPAAPQGRARLGSTSGPAAPADRVDLLDREGHPRPGAPRRPHPARPAGPHRQPLPRPCRRGRA